MKAKTKKRLLLGVFVLSLFALAPAFVRAYTIAGPSMAPTLFVGDTVLCSNAAYDLRVPYTDRVLCRTGEPRRGDVIVYFDTAKDSPAVKRVVGLPGDEIELRDNVLMINGVAASQWELSNLRLPEGSKAIVGEGLHAERLDRAEHALTYTPGSGERRDYGPTAVPEGEYFLLGDHRDNSADSRYIGCIAREQIRGRVFYGLRHP
ncbi:Signal peptidase IB [Planctomycetes bacterium MalM25]|nr:Signal peptidase IB [Planctomycetes bacterium MalM25]